MTFPGRSFVIRALNALVAVACCAAVASFLPVPTVTDAHLPLFAVSAAIAALAMKDGRRASLVLSAAPLLIVARLSFAEMEVRFAAYGVTLAAALVIAFFDLIDETDQVSTSRAVAFLVAVAVPFRFVAGSWETLLPNVLATAGGVLMLVLVSRKHDGAGAGRPPVRGEDDATAAGRPPVRGEDDGAGAGCPPVRGQHGAVAADALLAAILLTLVTPSLPLRLSFFSIFGAVLAWFVAFPSPFSVAAVVVASLLCGKWFAALAAAVFVLAFVRDRRVSAAKSMSAPAWFSPGLIASSARSSILAGDFCAPVARDLSLAPFLLLFVLAAVVKPGVAVLFAVAAVAIFSGVSAASVAVRGFLGALALYWVATSAWGGVIRHMFPAAAPLVAVVLLASIVFIAKLLPWERVTAIAAAALFIVLLGFRTTPASESLTTAFSLTRGESRSFRFEKGGRRVDVVAAGANLVGLTSGTKLGTIDYLDASGKAFRRELAVGDISDWGTFRDGHFFTSRNPLPDLIAGRVRGEGTTAALTGAGRIELDAPSPIVGINVTADANLPPNARLNFESVENATR